MRIQARARDADLPRVKEDRAGGARGCSLHIAIRKDHDRRLSAQLERNALQRIGRVPVDHLADFGRTGEGDFIDVGVFDEAIATGVAVARDHIDDACREARLGDEVGEPQRGQRCLFGGLQHDGTAGSQGRSDLAAAMKRGKFQGTICAATPTGSRRT